jgi:hypothetical protein
MKFTEINAIFSQKVAEKLNAGYVLNTNTMGGSQGDIAFVDLRKGDEVIRVRLHREMFSKIVDEKTHIWGNYIAITVGKSNDERVIANKGYDGYATIWNNQLEVLEERVFWQMDSRNSDWFIEGDEGIEALKKNNSRYNYRYPQTNVEIKGAEQIVLPAVKRHLGRKNYGVDNIMKVYKVWDNEEGRYEYKVNTAHHGTIKLA